MESSAVVVKVGGSEGIDYAPLCADAASLVSEGRLLVLIHGGSHETNRIAQQLGHPPEFVTSVSGYSSRRTDRTTLEIFAMVYAGKMNTLLVEQLQRRGVRAVGLSGLDGRLLEGPRKDSIKVVDPDGRRRVLHDDYTGRVERVNAGLLKTLLADGYTPVIAPLACSYAGEAMNVDGDRAAAMIAGTLQVADLVILSNVPGLLSRFPDPSSLIPTIAVRELEGAMSLAEGRMKKKVMGAAEALKMGVKRVIFADARCESPVRMALEGKGTVIM